MADRKVDQQPPLVLSLILADVVHRDGATGKYSILGIYSQLGVERFPFVVPAMNFYVALTDIHTRTPLRLRLVDVDEERPPVFEFEAVLDVADPTSAIELGVHHPNVLFPAPGQYSVELYGGGQLLHQLRIAVIALARQPR